MTVIVSVLILSAEAAVQNCPTAGDSDNAVSVMNLQMEKVCKAICGVGGRNAVEVVPTQGLN